MDETKTFSRALISFVKYDNSKTIMHPMLVFVLDILWEHLASWVHWWACDDSPCKGQGTKDDKEKLLERNYEKLDILSTYVDGTCVIIYEPWMLWRAACPRASRCWCVNLSNELSLCWPCHLRDKYCRIKLADMSIVECFNICLLNSNQEQCDGMFQLQSGMQRLILDACARLCYECKMVAVQGLLASL